jgi:hypothetical protein
MRVARLRHSLAVHYRGGVIGTGQRASFFRSSTSSRGTGRRSDRSLRARTSLSVGRARLRRLQADCAPLAQPLFRSGHVMEIAVHRGGRETAWRNASPARFIKVLEGQGTVHRGSRSCTITFGQAATTPRPTSGTRALKQGEGARRVLRHTASGVIQRTQEEATFSIAAVAGALKKTATALPHHVKYASAPLRHSEFAAVSEVFACLCRIARYHAALIQGVP